MLLMHCLAEITDRTLVFEQRKLWQQGLIEHSYSDCNHIGSPPTLAGDYLIHAQFNLDEVAEGEMGLLMQQKENAPSELSLRCVLHLSTGVWQIAEINERNSVKLLEKRGRLDGKISRIMDMYLLSVNNQYFFYIDDIDAPLFQCDHAALMSSPRFPKLHVDGHEMPVTASMKIWYFSSQPKGTLSLKALLAA